MTSLVLSRTDGVDFPKVTFLGQVDVVLKSWCAAVGGQMTPMWASFFLSRMELWCREGTPERKGIMPTTLKNSVQ